MAMKREAALAAILTRLKSTDISPIIRVAGHIVPRVLNPFFKSLDERQKSAIDKVLPRGKGRQIYIHLIGTPTPPIVIGMAQPVTIGTVSEKEVRQQRIKGIGLTIDDIQLLAKRRTRGTMLKLFWRLKGHTFTILEIVWIFMPLLLLGPSGLKDMRNKLTYKWKPLLRLFARPK